MLARPPRGRAESARLRRLPRPGKDRLMRLKIKNARTKGRRSRGAAPAQVRRPMTAPAAPAHGGSRFAEDPLALYLRQMGATPLLRRGQELELARELETDRRRFRHAALCNWGVLARVADTFESVGAGRQALERTIDVI